MLVLTYKKNLSHITFIAFTMLASSCKILKNNTSENAFSKEYGYENSKINLIYTKKIIETARAYTGTPYRGGGNDFDGIDCSGLLCNSFKELGIKLPRISWQQSEFFPAINLPNIQKGDLVFFVTVGKNISHAGIVTEVKSENEIIFIHASSSKGVIEDNMMSNYWKARFAKVCRPQFNELVRQ